MPDLAPPPQTVARLTVRVTLDDTEPEVWRRFTAPGDLRLDRAHHALQELMGWTNSHLHQFSLGPPYVSPKFLTEFDAEEGDEGILEADARLDQVLRRVGDELTYEYDFGDGWTHTLVLEQVTPMPAPPDGDACAQPGHAAYAITCLAGEGACPPEDVGGPPGYEEAAAWVRAGQDPAHVLDNGLTGEEMRRWLPPGWHPDHFDPDETNAALARLVPRDTSNAMGQLPSELVDVIGRLHGPARVDVDEWLSAPAWASPDHFTHEEALELTQPFRVLLDVVGDGVTLTPAGYLPGRVVEQVRNTGGIAGDWPGKGNREDLTPPVLDLRERARHSGLLRKVKGRLLPTALAGRLRDDPERLLEHVLSRTAVEGRAWQRVAGGLLLVAVVGGHSAQGRARGRGSDDLYDSLTRMVWVAGFGTAKGEPPNRWDMVAGARLHADALRLLSGDGDPELERRVSRALLRRMH